MVPIFKSGDSSKITNYRHISVLSFFSKVFEKVMYNHISDFIESVNVLYKYQFGFKDRGTQLNRDECIFCVLSTLLRRQFHKGVHHFPPPHTIFRIIAYMLVWSIKVNY